MIPPLSELVVRIPVETVFSQSLGVARDLGLPESAWQPISIGREVIYINSQIAANFSVVMQEGVAAGGFLTYAQGQWLTLCAWEIFDTERIDQASATGIIGLANDTDDPYPFGPGAVRVLNETTGQTYTNQTGGTVPAHGTLETVDFIADQPGTASNLTSADPLKLVVTVPGVTPFFVENLIGVDTETDPALKIRAREANAKASPNGPKDAYSYYAKTSTRDDGSAIGVTRTNVTQGNGTTTVWCATAAGALSVEDRADVFSNINANVVPTGFTVIVPNPSCIEKDVPVSVVFTPNPDSTEARSVTEARVQAAIVDYYATIQIGGAKAQSFQGVFRSTLNQIMRNAAGDAVLNLNMTLPAADVAMDPGEIPVLNTFNVGWST